MDEPTYKITRFYQNHPSTTRMTGLTLEEAQAHCRDPESSSSTATGADALAHTEVNGPWFDGFEEE